MEDGNKGVPPMFLAESYVGPAIQVQSLRDFVRFIEATNVAAVWRIANDDDRSPVKAPVQSLPPQGRSSAPITTAVVAKPASVVLPVRRATQKKPCVVNDGTGWKFYRHGEPDGLRQSLNYADIESGGVSRLTPKTVFPQSVFFVVIAGVAYWTWSLGFAEYQDMVRAIHRGFSDNAAYQEALERGVASFAELERLNELGIRHVTQVPLLSDDGLKNAYAIWHRTQQELLPQTGRPPNGELSDFVNDEVLFQGGFALDETSLAIQCYQKGFWRKEDFMAACDKGFESAADFFDAPSFGVSVPAQMIKVRDSGVETAKEWQVFLDLEREVQEEGFGNAAEYLLVQKAKGFKPGQSFDASVLLQAVLKDLARRGLKTGRLVEAMTNPQPNAPAFAATVLRSEVFVCFADGLCRRRFFSGQERRHAVLDISNIAWYGRDRTKGEGACIEPVISVVVQLKQWGFLHVVGIADATLPYDVGDEGVQKIGSILDDLTVIKSAEAADPHILEYAERHSCVIVSNDQYRDWVNDHHPWRQSNIPRVLVAFSARADGCWDWGQKGEDLGNPPDSGVAD